MCGCRDTYFVNYWNSHWNLFLLSNLALIDCWVPAPIVHKKDVVSGFPHTMSSLPGPLHGEFNMYQLMGISGGYIQHRRVIVFGIFAHSDLSGGALAIENQWEMIRLRDPNGENSAKRSHSRYQCLLCAKHKR